MSGPKPPGWEPDEIGALKRGARLRGDAGIFVEQRPGGLPPCGGCLEDGRDRGVARVDLLREHEGNRGVVDDDFFVKKVEPLLREAAQ